MCIPIERKSFNRTSFESSWERESIDNVADLHMVAMGGFQLFVFSYIDIRERRMYICITI